MCMAKQEPYSKMSDYRPKLPSNNAYDYYIAAARTLSTTGASASRWRATFRATRR